MTRARLPRPSRAAGFALMSALFVVVVLAGLAAAITTLATTQQVGAVRDVLGSRAYFAARAGIDWGAYQALQAGACAPSATLPALGGAAAGFGVVVACTRFPAAGAPPVREAGQDVVVYRLTSTASTGTPGATDFAERQLTAVVNGP